MPELFDNPMATDGFEFVEYAAPDPQALRALFERLIALCNDVGLLAEEYDPHARRQLGNFPQAFSHVGLINSAFNLSHDAKPAKTRGRHARP